MDRRESHRVSRTDPVAIVTGGSRGPGRELARKLASRGFAVVVVFLRDQGEAEAVVDGILAADGTAVAVRADVGDALDVERLFDATAAEFGELDVVVHAAVGRTAVVNQQAARHVSPEGVIIDVSGPVDVADVVALVERWRRQPGG